MLEDRYSRQVFYWGKENQQKIENSSVFVAGAGGLGGILCLMLSRAGIGKLVVCDNGIVDAPDLNRQALFTEKDIGRKKIDVAEEVLIKTNSNVEYVFINKKIDENFDFNFRHIDIITDCLDNYSARFCLFDKITDKSFYVHGGVDASTGQVISLKKGFSKNLREIFAGLENVERIIPVTPDSVNIVSSVMVREIFNIIFGNPLLLNKFWVINFEGLFVDFIEI